MTAIIINRTWFPHIPDPFRRKILLHSEIICVLFFFCLLCCHFTHTFWSFANNIFVTFLTSSNKKMFCRSQPCHVGLLWLMGNIILAWFCTSANKSQFLSLPSCLSSYLKLPVILCTVFVLLISSFISFYSLCSLCPFQTIADVH